MNTLRILLAIVGSLCFGIGWVAALSNRTAEDVSALGNTLIISGAICIGAVLISSAIVAKKNKE